MLPTYSGARAATIIDALSRSNKQMEIRREYCIESFLDLTVPDGGDDGYGDR